jgi:hypothetical protein
MLELVDFRSPQLGTIDYAAGLRLQQRLVVLRKAGRVGDIIE